MSERSLLASSWALDVNTGTSASPTWTRVKGMTNFKETLATTVEDDSDFDSNGWGSDQTTQRKWSLVCQGKRKRDADSPVTFIPDAGQQFVIDAGNVVGLDSNIEIRYYRRDGSPDAWQGFASVQYEGGGGGTTNLEPMNFTLSGQGERTRLNPYPTLTAA